MRFGAGSVLGVGRGLGRRAQSKRRRGADVTSQVAGACRFFLTWHVCQAGLFAACSSYLSRKSSHTPCDVLGRILIALTRVLLGQALLPSPTASAAHAINLASSQDLVLAAVDNQRPPRMCYATQAALDLWV